MVAGESHPSVSAFENPKTMLNRLIDTRIVPGMSSLGRASVVCGASNRNAPTRAIAANTRFTNRHQRQSTHSVSAPPSNSPTTPPPPATAPKMPKALARSPGSVKVTRQQRQSRRSKKGSEHTLARTSRNKHLEVDGRAPDGGGNRKSDQSDDKCAPSAEQIAQPTTEQQQAAEGQGIRGDNPLSVSVTELQ